MDIKSLKECCKEICLYEMKNKDDYETIDVKLSHLFDKYSKSLIFGEFSKLISVCDAIKIFENSSLFNRKIKAVKTIGVQYWRMYNGGIERVVALYLNIWSKMGLNVVLLTDEESSEKDYQYPSSVKRIILPSQNNMKNRLSVLEKTIIELFSNFERQISAAGSCGPPS